MATDPRSEYVSLLADRKARVEGHKRRSGIIADARMGTFLAGIAVVWMMIGPRWIGPGWLLLPIGAFAALVILHDRTRHLQEQAERAVTWYERGLARLDGTWAGTGESGIAFRSSPHPYADDIDLFGKGSLFELLCTTRTRAGEEALARWLQHPAEPAEVLERQESVRELSPRLDLREELSLLGEDVKSGGDLGSLMAWGKAPPVSIPASLRPVAASLAVLNGLGLAAWLVPGIGPLAFTGALLLTLAFLFLTRHRVREIIEEIERRGRDVTLFSTVLGRLERERFTSRRLVSLQGVLSTGGTSAASEMARLRRLVDLLDSRRNELFIPIAFVLLWTPQVAFAIEAWRRRCGPALAGWLSSLGEIEALAALSACAYERPENRFPDFSADGPLFDGEGLGHPLIPDSRAVRNDVKLDGQLRLLVVSGSNMSGKSTLLRTLGANLALANAGAPVRARRLRLSALTLGASIGRQDSLQENTSRFYAEIARIRQIVDLTRGPRPVLFLIDEILSGTNSHDRRIGSEAVVRSLLNRGAIGLVTTHDLSLAQVAEALKPRAANVHFEDHLEDGRMAFDYRLRPGIVEKSNALELMRAMGIDV